MNLAQPYFLLLLLPAAAFLVWLKIGGGHVTARLPGHWRRVIDVSMQSYMAGRTVAESKLPVALWGALWLLLIVALARPAIDFGEPTAYGNLAGRVIAIDLGAEVDINKLRFSAYRILDASPDVPTAVIVSTADAFDVVPLTTDRKHLDRYIHVIDPDVVPILGRSLEQTISHAEAILARAEVVVGQMVLITGNTAPSVQLLSEGPWLRAIVVGESELSHWTPYAEAVNARLSHRTDIQDLVVDLDQQIEDAIRNSDDAASYPLAPWLVGAAALLWLFFFRRRRLL